MPRLREKTIARLARETTAYDPWCGAEWFVASTASGRPRMTDRIDPPDPLEEQLAQLQELEEAGVFKRTPVDAEGLVQPGAGVRRLGRLHRLFVALQAAACLAVVVGVVSLWHREKVPPVLVSGPSNANTAARAADPGILAQCLAGPATPLLGGECRVVDFDADEDVDLADFGALQRSLTGNR